MSFHGVAHNVREQAVTRTSRRIIQNISAHSTHHLGKSISARAPPISGIFCGCFCTGEDEDEGEEEDEGEDEGEDDA